MDLVKEFIADTLSEDIDDKTIYLNVIRANEDKRGDKVCVIDRSFTPNDQVFTVARVRGRNSASPDVTVFKRKYDGYLSSHVSPASNLRLV